MREVKNNGPITPGSSGSQKREGPTPLQELDPNVLSQKKRKGRTKLSNVSEQQDQMDGGEAAAAVQPRRAQ